MQLDVSSAGGRDPGHAVAAGGEEHADGEPVGRPAQATVNRARARQQPARHVLRRANQVRDREREAVRVRVSGSVGGGWTRV